MKKIKLLLLTLAVLALLVTGMSLTVFANDSVSDTTLFTINGEECDDEETAIPDGATVVVYQECLLEYNEKATYTVAQGSLIALSWVDSAEGLVEFFEAEDASYVNPFDGDTVSIYSTCEGIAYYDGVTYVVSDAIDFTVTTLDGSEIGYFAVDETDKTSDVMQSQLKGNASYTEGYVITLLNDVTYYVDCSANAAYNGELGANVVGNDDKCAEIYIDVNGHALTRIDNSTQATSGAMFNLCDKKQANYYFLSSVEGGAICHLNKTAEGFVTGALVENFGSNSSINLGTVRLNGKLVSGDNLSVYFDGFAAANVGVFQTVNVDGGYYYTSQHGLMRAAVVFNNSKLNIKNAYVYSECGTFFDLGLADSMAIDVDDCVFYSPSTVYSYAPITLVTGKTTESLYFTNCEFIIAKGGFHVLRSGGMGNPSEIDLNFENCVTNAARSASCVNGPQYGFLYRNYKQTYNFNIPAYTGEGVTVAETPVAANYAVILTDSVFQHNITLSSDFIYNVYVPASITNVTVGGVEATVTQYDHLRSVVSIPVSAMKALDEIMVVATDGETPYTLTTSVMKYVDQALAAYSGDAILKPLLNAVKDYAKAAAAYAGYNAEGFAAYEYSKTLTTAENSGKEMADVSENFKKVISGAYLNLNSEVKFVFTVAENATGTAVLNYNYGGKAVNETVTVDGKTEITVVVKASDLNSDISVTVGNETLKYNLQNYIYAMSSDATHKEDANLMALLAYLNQYAATAVFQVCDHAEGDVVTENIVEKVDTKEVQIHGSHEEVIYCSVCGVELWREKIFDAKVPLGDFTFTINEDDTYTVTGLSADGKNVKNLVIPEGVTRIADQAFYNLPHITSVELPEGLIYIGQSAFYRASITSIELPSTVEDIANYAFRKTKLTSVVIPASVLRLKFLMFGECDNLTSIVIMNPSPIISNFAFFQKGAENKVIYRNVAYESMAELEQNRWCHPDDNTTGYTGSTVWGAGFDNRIANIYYLAPENPVSGQTYWKMVDGVPTTYVAK